MNPVLEISGLTLTADLEGGPVEALCDIDLSVASGRTLGLVGESGAGKSMIGRLVSGLLPVRFRISAGRIAFQGRDLAAQSEAARRALLGREIAFIPQEPRTSLNPALTVGQQFGEHLKRLNAGDATARRARIVAALESVHLPNPPELLGKYPHQLSGGMCQRVLIAMAFASQPKLIVADEPTTALDVMTQARIMALLAEMKRGHDTAVILITHDLRLAAQACDDLAVLYAGEVVEKGPAKLVFSDPRHPYTAALKRSNPPLSGERRRVEGLADRMPSLLAYGALSGCRFAPRCPVADAACAAGRPALAEVAPGRWARASAACRDGTAGRRDAAGARIVDFVPPRDSTPVLEVKGLSKEFAGARRLFGGRAAGVKAVQDVALDLHPGEILGIVGESGSGKSTLARLILGLETPDAGAIRLAGKDVTGPLDAHRAARTAAIQMVFQDPQSALNPRRRVGSTVTQAMEAGGRRASWTARLDEARKLLAATGLPEDAALRYPPELSGGQRQRVNIARALCASPRVLVADEIVSGLDVSIQAQILNLLLALRETQSIAVLFVSHDISVVRYLCDRVAVMHRGRVVESGPVRRVFDTPMHDYTRALLAAVPPDDAATDWRPSTRYTADG
jgi:peptide/nickel transport system ATP-binding protein